MDAPISPTIDGAGDTAGFDPLAVDAYGNHLAKVNESQQVVAAEDIVNAQGAVVVKKGAAIDQRTIDRIVRFKLMRPLEDHVAIEQEINAQQLLQDIAREIGADPQWQALYSHCQCEDLLEPLAAGFEKAPILRQKITVMAERLPDLYRRSLHCAWLTALLGQRLGYPQRTQQAAFLAGLCRDIGMLHIDPTILEVKGEYSPEQWRQMQAHVVIGYQIIDKIGTLDEQIATALLEHHERCDGSGYPYGRVDSELSELGKLVALTDSMVAVYFNRFVRERRGLRDLLPILQINRSIQHRDGASAMIVILRELEKQAALPAVTPNIKAVYSQSKSAQRLFQRLYGSLKGLGFTHGDRALHSIQNVLLHVATSLHDAGILEDFYLRWIEHSCQQPNLAPDAAREIEDVKLMLYEVNFHLVRLRRMLSLYISQKQAKDPKLHQRVEGLLQELNSATG